VATINTTHPATQPTFNKYVISRGVVAAVVATATGAVLSTALALFLTLSLECQAQLATRIPHLLSRSYRTCALGRITAVCCLIPPLETHATEPTKTSSFRCRACRIIALVYPRPDNYLVQTGAVHGYWRRMGHTVVQQHCQRTLRPGLHHCGWLAQSSSCQQVRARMCVRIP
jgi:hypothetical protein